MWEQLVYLQPLDIWLEDRQDFLNVVKVIFHGAKFLQDILQI